MRNPDTEQQRCNLVYSLFSSSSPP